MRIIAKVASWNEKYQHGQNARNQLNHDDDDDDDELKRDFVRISLFPPPRRKCDIFIFSFLRLFGCNVL